MGLTQRTRDGRRLDELRAVADDREDVHLGEGSAERILWPTAAATPAVTGPGASNVRSSIAETAWTSRVVDAMNTSSAAVISSSVQERSTALACSITIRRVIEARMCSSSGGVSTAPSLTQKTELVGASSPRPCGVTSRASSNPCSRASLDASMFAAYDNDLTPSSRRVGV